MLSSFFFIPSNRMVEWIIQAIIIKKREHKSSRFVSSSPVPMPVTVSTFAFLFAPNEFDFSLHVYEVVFFFRFLSLFFFFIHGMCLSTLWEIEKDRVAGAQFNEVNFWLKFYFIFQLNIHLHRLNERHA